MRLSGKTALVTGGGSGIGLATAVALAREGCRVVIAGRDEAKLKAAAAEYASAGKILCHPVEVASRESVQKLVAWTEKELGPIDILVNSAGTNVVKRSLAELSPEDWQRMLDVNATGAFHAMQAVLPGMRERHDGLIVNIGSIAGKRAGLLGGVGYNASKFALAALGITASLEDGQRGIRVTTVHPGEVDTPILKNRPVPVTEEHRARILQSEDVAAAVLMVACLPPRAHVPELVIKPTSQDYV
ncbi:MAG: SDR family oxidoreductase [Pirellulales bacterium]|nr:SDR family oxidoreductase [Pirellulales bacterium]